MPQDKTYLNNVVDLCLSVPVSEISLFWIAGQFECNLENWKSVSEQVITSQLNKPLLLLVNSDLCCAWVEMKVQFAQSAEWWVWSGHISWDKQQRCEVNQAKGLAVVNCTSAKCVSQKAYFMVYVHCWPLKVTGYSAVFIFKWGLAMGHKHHFHVYNKKKCGYNFYLNSQFSLFNWVLYCPGELNPAMKFLCDAGQVI